jgi:hypothetical protein
MFDSLIDRTALAQCRHRPHQPSGGSDGNGSNASSSNGGAAQLVRVHVGHLNLYRLAHTATILAEMQTAVSHTRAAHNGALNASTRVALAAAAGLTAQHYVKAQVIAQHGSHPELHSYHHFHIQLAFLSVFPLIIRCHFDTMHRFLTTLWMSDFIYLLINRRHFLLTLLVLISVRSHARHRARAAPVCRRVRRADHAGGRVRRASPARRRGRRGPLGRRRHVGRDAIRLSRESDWNSGRDGADRRVDAHRHALVDSGMRAWCVRELLAM